MYLVPQQQESMSSRPSRLELTQGVMQRVRSVIGNGYNRGFLNGEYSLVPNEEEMNTCYHIENFLIDKLF